MEYALITLLQIIGIGFHAAQKIAGIRSRNNDKKIREIISIFWNEDWNTLLISALVLALCLTVHFIVLNYFPKSISGHEWYYPISFGIALLFGYMGQRKIYQLFGTAENVFDKQVASKMPS